MAWWCVHLCGGGGADCDVVVPRTRGAAGLHALRHARRHLERRLHLRRAGAQGAVGAPCTARKGKRRPVATGGGRTGAERRWGWDLRRLCVPGACVRVPCPQQPLFPGDCELQQLLHIFRLLGTPSENVWQGVTKLRDWCAPAPLPKPLQLHAREAEGPPPTHDARTCTCPQARLAPVAAAGPLARLPHAGARRRGPAQADAAVRPRQAHLGARQPPPAGWPPSVRGAALGDTGAARSRQAGPPAV